jgi:hypothetical protein
VRAILADLAAWPGEALNRHNDAGHLLHKLSLLADLVGAEAPIAADSRPGPDPRAGAGEPIAAKGHSR